MKIIILVSIFLLFAAVVNAADDPTPRCITEAKAIKGDQCQPLTNAVTRIAMIRDRTQRKRASIRQSK